MSEDIRVMSAQLAADPTSLVFLPLGEALRQRRQLEAARKVTLAGLSRYPDLADAHDLYARILGDEGDLEQAFDEWGIALQLDPKHAGAQKGIGFLYFVAGDFENALRHLEAALAAMPGDEGLQAATQRVYEAQGRAGTPETPPAPREEAPSPAEPVAATEAIPSEAEVFSGLEGANGSLLLLDQQGRRLGGGLRSPRGEDVADQVAAHLAGVSLEAARTARILELGAWHSVTVQSADANLHMVAPTADSVLLVVRGPEIPLGRLAVLSERAATSARRWLEEFA